MLEQRLEARLRVHIRGQVNQCEAIFVDDFRDVEVCAGQDACKTSGVAGIDASDNLALIMLLVKYFLKA